MNANYIKPIWQVETEETTRCGLNLFIEKCMHAFGKEGEIVDYEKLHISTGHLLQPSGMESERVRAREIRLTWSPLLLSDRESNGRVTKCAGDLPCLGVARGDGRVSIQLPDNILGRVHLYCFFKSKGRHVYSDDWHFSFPATEKKGKKDFRPPY